MRRWRLVLEFEGLHIVIKWHGRHGMKGIT